MDDNDNPTMHTDSTPGADVVGPTFERFVQKAREDAELELELGIDLRITQTMFGHLVNTLSESLGPPEDSLQLDVVRNGVRLEYVGEPVVSAALSSADSCSVQPTRAMVKRRERAPVKHDMYEFTIKLKREILDVAEAEATTGVSIDAFRLKRRYTFTAGSVCRIDCTVVQSRAPGDSSQNIPFAFEVEVELTDRSSELNPAEVVETMTGVARRCIGIMTGTSCPLTRSELAEAENSYAELSKTTTGSGKGPGRAVLVGPQPVTLTRSHICPGGDSESGEDEYGAIWSGEYTVTDKADGSRCQIFCDNSRVFSIDTAKNVRLVARNAPGWLNGTWLDGELITVGRNGEAMNHFACFDAYAVGSNSTLSYPLVEIGAADVRGGRADDGPAISISVQSRVSCAQRAIEAISEAEAEDGFTAVVKKFSIVDKTGSAIRDALDDARNGRPYHTDGLIFTPARNPVGARFVDEDPHISGTWYEVLKWKPPSQNSIDVLVRTTDAGVTGGASSEYTIYCSYRPQMWESIDVMRFIQFGDRSIPSDTPVPRAFDLGGDKSSRMRVAIDARGRATCNNGEIIYDNTILECAWRDDQWVPMRTRPEKTARIRQGVVGANDWSTARSVWDSIRFPITEEVLTRIDDCPSASSAGISEAADEGASAYYYAPRTFGRARTVLKNMNAFHNIVVKARLYRDAVERCDAVDAPALFELACGKGGDLSRWIESSFGCVVGIDSCMDNIVNSIDGVYRRLSNMRPARSKATKGSQLTSTMAFVCLDACTNMLPPLDEIKVASRDCPHGDLILALWDAASEPSPLTQTSLSPYIGLVRRGFDVVSCQFAIHYMFQEENKRDRFLDNVAWACNPGGVFIGTCFDGLALARLFESRPVLEARGWSISKRFEGEFVGDCGAAIDVKIETIGKSAREYLVCLETLSRLLNERGFDEVYVRPFREYAESSAVEGEAASTGDAYADAMSPDERELSFMNSAFMFKKRRAE